MKISPLKDEKTYLHLVSKGNELAFTVIFKHYSNLIFSFALRLTRSDDLSEEITQEVFLKIWVNRESLDSVDNFEAYLKRITRNHSFNVLKRINHQVQIFGQISKEMTEHVTNTENEIHFRETDRILNIAIDKLTPQQKIIYNLCHQEGLKYADVAKQLNISPGTVHTHMKNALRLIRSHMTKIDIVILCILFLNR